MTRITQSEFTATFGLDSYNFKQGVVANSSDREKYESYKQNNDGSRKWEEVRREVGYDNPLPSMRKREFQKDEKIVDATTGMELPKDGRAHIDHITSAKTHESRAELHLFMTQEERVSLANNEKNLAWMEGSANQSKGDSSYSEWQNKTDKKTGTSKAEKYGIDTEKTECLQKKSESNLRHEENKAATKKYVTDIVSTGLNDAANSAKMVAYSAIGVILKELVSGIMYEIRLVFKERGNESFSEIFKRFKKRVSTFVAEIKGKYKDILAGSFEVGITAFLSNIVVFIINLFATTLKKFVSMIRAGFSSLVQAIKIMSNPPVGMTQDEVNHEALKILTAGIIGAISLGWSVAIEKMLQAIPGLQPLMMFPIPFIGSEARTVSDIIAVTLSSMAAGILTTVTLYFMDKLRENSMNSKIRIQMVTTSGVVMQYQLAKTWFALDDAYKHLESNIVQAQSDMRNLKNSLNESNNHTSHAIYSLEEKIQRMKALTWKGKS